SLSSPYPHPASLSSSFLFFFNNPPPTEISTLSLHDALPISGKIVLHMACCEEHARHRQNALRAARAQPLEAVAKRILAVPGMLRSEEHTSELQSLTNLVCRLLLEKKNRNDQAAS